MNATLHQMTYGTTDRFVVTTYKAGKPAQEIHFFTRGAAERFITEQHLTLIGSYVV